MQPMAGMMTHMTTLEGKVGIVTGGGGHIGRGVCQALAEAGADVAVFDINAEAAEGTAAAVREETGRRALAIAMDLTDRAACERSISQVAEEFGGIDILVNCAQIFRSFIPFLEITEDDMAISWASGVMTTFRMMQLCYPYLAERGGGSIVNFGSGVATEGQAGHAAYGSAKEGIRLLSKVGSQEWGRDGIRVNTICPLASKDPETKAWYTEEFRTNIPLRHMGDPRTDIGAAIVYLAGPGSFVTGHTLMVDGGVGRFR
jgi:NAD(P)-dependent dehydrogenase (short-subunit alcohol dehydrogenase family)